MNSDKYDIIIEESTFDKILFIPLSDFLIPYFYFFRISPNSVTFFSSLFTLISIYLFFFNNIYCLVFYFLGYLFDSIDGRLARRYNLVSTLGMVLDLVSDNITNFPLIIVFLYKSFNDFSFTKIILVSLIFISLILFSISFGITESLSCYLITKDDNFYNLKKEIISKSNFSNNMVMKRLALLYLFINKSSYQSFRLVFNRKINNNNKNDFIKYLFYLKEFGPGNLNLFILLNMFYFLISSSC